ncbi:hypothetical protein Q604_UNBC08329G0001, partial [human gut metagenome]
FLLNVFDFEENSLCPSIAIAPPFAALFPLKVIFSTVRFAVEPYIAPPFPVSPLVPTLLLIN